MAADYMETEDGLTKEEADRACARLRANSRTALASGDYLTLFNREGDPLVVELPGNHNDVQRYLRNLR